LLVTGIAAAALVGSVLVGGQALAEGQGQGTGGKPYDIALSGANEFNAAGVPINVHGDADHGTVNLQLNQGQERVCWQFGALTLTAGENLPILAHIHRAVAGVAGPVVINFFGTADTGAPPTSYPTDVTCVHASKDLIQEIRLNPEGFYVNMHNVPTHPAGVMRGQLG